MNKTLLLIALNSILLISHSQFWDVTEIGQLPNAVSNNAVSEGYVGSTPYLYSFGGIDTTKNHNGINLHSYRINTLTGVSETLADLPDTLGKIASSASRIHDIIYIIGGYHVFSNGNEVSSNKIHRFNTSLNNFMTDGANIPIAIDDHVQATWKDSLIFVITGWSNNGNVPNVQIYNPFTNTWNVGTNLPNNNNYKSFGASGTIIGDTIYYFGGASLGFNFPAQNQLRKGIINPNNPTDITWSVEVPDNQIKGYRMACTNIGNQAHWIGGSNTTYNYDGIAYNNSGGVSPNNRDLYFDTDKALIWTTNYTQNFPMDLRGIASINDSLKYIAGGMLENQDVTNKVYRLNWNYSITKINEKEKNRFDIYPNPVLKNGILTIETKGVTQGNKNISFYNLSGQLMHQTQINSTEKHIQIPELAKGIYYIEIITKHEKSIQKIIIQ